MINGVGDGTNAVLVLAFESADHPLRAWIERALELAAACGGDASETTTSADLTTLPPATETTASSSPTSTPVVVVDFSIETSGQSGSTPNALFEHHLEV